MAVGRLPEGNDLGGESIVAEINITPLTDIFLVLLIIFMVTSSAMVESGPSVNLPEAGETSTQTKGVTVTVDETESLFADGVPATRESLTAAFDGFRKLHHALGRVRTPIQNHILNALE